jgi:hypothetical protein
MEGGIVKMSREEKDRLLGFAPAEEPETQPVPKVPPGVRGEYGNDEGDFIRAALGRLWYR